MRKTYQMYTGHAENQSETSSLENDHSPDASENRIDLTHVSKIV